MKKILFITSNKGKLLEAEKLLSPLGYEVEQLEISYPEIQASGLDGVVSFGMEWILKEGGIKEPFLIEDAGLFIKALNGFPSVFSAYVFKSIGLDEILRLMEGKEDRNAYFESCIGYYDDKTGIKIFSGKVEGTIVIEKKGDHGFGYDPIFIPEGEKRTFAEMTTEEKNKLSHRGESLRRLAEFLGKN
jgi:XTP/dITP diphosphohydrolase